MAERQMCLSVPLFLLHPLVIKAKFCANKHSDTVGRKSRYQADVLCSITCYDASDWNGFCWCYALNKGWRRHIGFGAGRAFRIKHEVKIPISFALAMLLLCGDICLNPGPRNIRYPCGICKKAVKSNQQEICCDLCEIWFHTRSSCLNMMEETYKAHSENINLQWSCNQCSDLQRDGAELNSTENQPFINDGFSDIKNSLHQQPGLNVGHLNTEGLRGKLPKIELLLLETNLDILSITKTKLPLNVSDEEIGIDGYFVA